MKKQGGQAGLDVLKSFVPKADVVAPDGIEVVGRDARAALLSGHHRRL